MQVKSPTIENVRHRNPLPTNCLFGVLPSQDLDLAPKKPCFSRMPWERISRQYIITDTAEPIMHNEGPVLPDGMNDVAPLHYITVITWYQSFSNIERMEKCEKHISKELCYHSASPQKYLSTGAKLIRATNGAGRLKRYPSVEARRNKKQKHHWLILKSFVPVPKKAPALSHCSEYLYPTKTIALPSRVLRLQPNAKSQPCYLIIFEPNPIHAHKLVHRPWCIKTDITYFRASLALLYFFHCPLIVFKLFK